MNINTTAQIESPGRRAAAYWFVDGLEEIAFGLALLIRGVWGIAWGELHWRNWWMWVGFPAAELLLLALLLMHRRILDSLKARITYPRTGYVRPPADFPSKSNPPDKILTLGTGHQVDENDSSFRNHTVLLFMVGSIFVIFLEARCSLPLVMAAVAAGVYLWNRDDVRPYSWRAVLPIILAGFIAAGLDLEPKNRFFVPLVIGGTWLLGIGTWTLVHYLRAHPKSDAGREGVP
jgi:hypothetical protein